MADPREMTRSPLEEQGVPDHAGGLEDQGLSDLEDEYMTPPGDRPRASVDYGTTAEEQRHDEPLGDRLAREQPETQPGEGFADEDGTGPDPADRVGRIVEDDEGARTDDVKENVAYDRGVDSGGFSAEEAAMHITDEV